MLAYNISDTMITIVTAEGPIHVPRKGKRAADVIKALNNGETDPEVLRELADPTTFINTTSGGRIAIKNGVASVDGDPLPSLLSKRLVQLVNDGIDVSYLVKFHEKLQRNPSKRAVEELFTFLQHGGMPITPEGNFLGYKGVRDDYMDVHSGKFSNRVGNRIRMPRNKVCDDANVGCSVGFHVGSEAYATSWGCRTVIVEVNPEHVVSVPHDCDFQKLRTCEYKVVSDYKERMRDTAVEDASLPYSGEVICEDDFEANEHDVTVEAGW